MDKMSFIHEFVETQFDTNFNSLSQLIIIVDGLTTLYEKKVSFALIIPIIKIIIIIMQEICKVSYNNSPIGHSTCTSQTIREMATFTRIESFHNIDI